MDYSRDHRATTQYSGTETNDNIEHFYVDSMNANSNRIDAWYVTLNIGPNKQKIKFKIDTGAQIDVLPYDMYKRLNLDKVCTFRNGKVRLSGYGGIDIPIKGTCMLSVGHNHTVVTKRFVISEANSGPTLSCQSSVDLKLIARLDTLITDKNVCEEILKNTLMYLKV